jgi:MraZ protein
MLSGQYNHSCDEKFRLRLPSRIKAEIGTSYYVTKGNDGCLFILSSQQINNMLAKTDALPIFDSAAQKALRLLYSSAYEVSEDNQGRFLLPQHLREFAGIKKEVVFIGAGNRAELWAADKWKTYKDDMDKNFDKIISELGKHGV